MATGALAVGLTSGPVAVREVATGIAATAAFAALVVAAVRRSEGVDRFPLGIDLVAPAVGMVALVAAGLDAGGPPALAVVRTLIGAAFLGAVSDAMLLGHWYLVQPGLPRGPLLEMVRWAGRLWPFELAVLLWPTGMVSVLAGTVDDGYGGLLGWFWLACTAASKIGRASCRERV